jgi:hypothetical protein
MLSTFDTLDVMRASRQDAAAETSVELKTSFEVPNEGRNRVR